VEDEIDLREYIDVLIRHWKAIVALTVIAAIVAGVWWLRGNGTVLLLTLAFNR